MNQFIQLSFLIFISFNKCFIIFCCLVKAVVCPVAVSFPNVPFSVLLLVFFSTAGFCAFVAIF